MIELRNAPEKQKWLQIYRKQIFFFPIIAAVLNENQNGLVFVSKKDNASCLLVIHKFGFAQIICGKYSNDLKEEILQVLRSDIRVGETRLLKFRFFCAEKELINSIGLSEFNYQTGERVRFVLPDYSSFNPLFSKVEEEEINRINETFQLDLDCRFWNNRQDFIKKGLPFVSKDQHTIKSICYAAASEDGFAEIDVFTNEKYRGMGYAKEAVRGFIQNCLAENISPLWDCYSNNIGSMKTAKSIGFIESYRYEFLIVSK